MFGTLILSILAGAIAPTLQPALADLAAKVIGEDNLPDDGGRKVASFAAALLGAAILSSLLGWGGRPGVLLIGGVIGYFHKELRAAIMSRLD